MEWTVGLSYAAAVGQTRQDQGENFVEWPTLDCQLAMATAWPLLEQMGLGPPVAKASLPPGVKASLASLGINESPRLKLLCPKLAASLEHADVEWSVLERAWSELKQALRQAPSAEAPATEVASSSSAASSSSSAQHLKKW